MKERSFRRSPLSLYWKLVDGIESTIEKRGGMKGGSHDQALWNSLKVGWD